MTTDEAIIRTLRTLRTPAPTGLAGRVLVSAGVADGYTVLDGPAGPVYVAFNQRGVSACRPATSAAAFERLFRQRFDRPVVPLDPPPRLASRLASALATGKLGRLPVDLGDLTEFQQAVLRKAAEIPPGEVRPYSWIAREIGRPGAVRAVGTALGNNPVPVLVPCHRVVRADGSIGAYALGEGVKRTILASEGVDVAALEEWAVQGRRFTGSDTTRIFCHPTCRHARRVSDRHRRWFGSAGQAGAAGYRPCKVCRPAAA